jgi:hypothetical protein
MSTSNQLANHTTGNKMSPPTPTAASPPASSVTNEPEKLDDEDASNLAILNMVGYNTTLTGGILALLARRITGRKKPLPEIENVTWAPFHFLFYGTLQNPRVIHAVVGLAGPQDLRKARIEGFRSKMWTDTIPMAVPCEGAVLRGHVWRVPSAEAVFRLVYYESEAYKMAKCRILLDDGEVIEEGRVFVSAGCDDDELEEGEFDLEAFLGRAP